MTKKEEDPSSWRLFFVFRFLGAFIHSLYPETQPTSKKNLSFWFSILIEETFLEDASTKDKIKNMKNKFDEHVTIFAAYESWKIAIAQILVIIKYVAFFIFSFSAPRFINQVYHLALVDMVKNFLSAIIVAWILLLLIILPNLLFQIYTKISVSSENSIEKILDFFNRTTPLAHAIKWWPTILVSLYTMRLINIQMLVLGQGLPINNTTELIAIVTVLSIILVFKIITAFEQLLFTLIEKWKNRNHVDSTIIINLVIVTRSIFGYHPWSSYETWQRQQLIDQLEQIAYHFETSLPRQLLGDPLNSVLSIKQDLVKIGGGVRALESKVAIPNSDTWSKDLRQEIISFLVNFLSLNWAALPSELIEVRQVPNIISRLSTIFRSIITGSIPSIVFALVQNTPMRLHGDRADLVLIFTLIWLAISVITVLDPDFNMKTKALKDIQDSFPFKNP